MRRTQTPIAAALIALALTLAACSDDDDKEASPASREGVEGPRQATPPSGRGGLPPGFARCMADQGFEIESPNDIHSAPPRALQACFGSIHDGGGVP